MKTKLTQKNINSNCCFFANISFSQTKQDILKLRTILNNKLEFSLEGNLDKVYRNFIALYTGVTAFDGM